MKIEVDNIYGHKIKLLHDAGWTIVEYLEYEKSNEYFRDRAFHRHLCGVEMEKDFESFGDAIREFEKVTGYDAIGMTNHDGDASFSFRCNETQTCVSGWGCGKYLYELWEESPRKTLIRLNLNKHIPQNFPYSS